MEHKQGVYETEYGNACIYAGGKTAYDMDMGERIPTEMVNFNKFLRVKD